MFVGPPPATNWIQRRQVKQTQATNILNFLVDWIDTSTQQRSLPALLLILRHRRQIKRLLILRIEPTLESIEIAKRHGQP